jgi:DNA polymerase-3 subunit delta'
MKPYEASMRVVLILDAQTMNPSASNALLKVLEEPPAGTILILVATHTSDLLPTIVSRCRHIRFNPISRANMESILIHNHGLDSGDARIIASMAGGSLSRALHMYRANWISRRNWLINELDTLSSEPISRLLAFGEQLAKNKDVLQDSLEIMKSWLRDIAIGGLCPEKIIHQDLAENARRISQKMSMKSLLSKIETIQSTQNSIQSGTNIRLAMEAMILNLSRI